MQAVSMVTQQNTSRSMPSSVMVTTTSAHAQSSLQGPSIIGHHCRPTVPSYPLV